ncbi:MAG TPA: 16S rRNA (adenine(1518)-N(6)/adenine(1519)-N(6))-dimethyltransferase RsmA [Candidatus Dormibacteraeota bacterium]|jgi:16S rRNA (adenine1518-N6/adenine1519-N6)-dimethyltransferase|nr:16S rRNA (adenine(1518)-N(6)/adenine(1519)-N(6))-dimethyltransferase RsmA [Candidatus Dormibacteraeota bacterium]
MTAAQPGRRRLDLTDPGTVRAVARRAGLSLKHRLGQNFLVDREVLERIVDALSLSPEDEVFEVGPGIGTLTVELASRAGRVLAAELDEACLRATAITLRDHPNAEVIHRDALRVDPVEAGLHDGYLAAGNIPYQITAPLISHLLELPVPPRRAVLLVQREVAARLAAPPGDWSLVTVAVRSMATVERLGDVPPSAFEPPPAVHSSILRLTPAPQLDAATRAAVLDLARGAFQMRRKTLRHGLGHALAGAGGEDAARAVLAAAGIDPGRRPETLDLDEWRQLAGAAARTAPGPVAPPPPRRRPRP